ncbi:MAG: FAD-dependent oxidoreductase [Pseudomonadota bacterium]
MSRIVIVGAGMAGLAAARRLADAGLEPLVLDKGRGIGGRLSTRRAEGAQFDHGAQYMSSKTDAFEKVLRMATKAEAAAIWGPETSRRYVGHPGMNALPKWLARGIEVRLGVTVTAVRQGPGPFRLETTDGEVTADRLVLTPPVPQILDILGPDHVLAPELARVSFAPCATLMAITATDLPEVPETQQSRGEPIAWIARDHAKPGRPKKFAWVAQASPEWSRRHLELPKEALAEAMVPLFCQCLGIAKEEVVYSAGHRWRFAHVERPLGKAFAASPDQRLYVAGDGCRGPRAEDAWLSGDAVAIDLLSRL